MRPEVTLLACVSLECVKRVGDEDFAVLERAERAGVDVQVRIEFLQADAQPAALEETADRRRGNPFAQR